MARCDLAVMWIGHPLPPSVAERGEIPCGSELAVRTVAWCAVWPLGRADNADAGLTIGCVVASAGVCAWASLGWAAGKALAQRISSQHTIDWAQTGVDFALVGANALGARAIGGKGVLSVGRRTPKTAVKRYEYPAKYSGGSAATLVDMRATTFNFMVNPMFGMFN